MGVSGHYFLPLSSFSQRAYLVVDERGAHMHLADGSTRERLSVKFIQEHSNMQFDDGSYFKADETLPMQIIREFHSTPRQLISALERFSLAKGCVWILLLIMSFLVYRLALNTMEDVIVERFPETWERSIGVNAFETAIELGVFSHSDMPIKRQIELNQVAEMLSARAGYDLDISLTVIDSAVIGANAFAFPGGTIAVTEELIALLDHDELLSVIAHEIGHIERRHALKNAVESFGLTMLAYVWLGQGDIVIQRLSDFMVHTWNLKNSREAELEADRAAIEILRASDIRPENFISALRRLQESACEPYEREGLECGEDADRADWYSTHPSTDLRIQVLEEGIGKGEL